MADTMTNEEIMSEFAELFGSNEPSDEKDPEPEEETTPEETPEEETPTEEEVLEEQTDDSPKDETEPPKDTPPVPKQSKQNHAFAEQRVQIKKQNDFIRSIGRLIGFDDKASLEEIQQKVAEVLLEKQSKEQGVPVELLQRLEKAESLIQENEQIKLEKKISEDFSKLIDEHSLTDEEVTEFTAYLIDNGKNPMLDSTVDIKAEYLKLHMNDIVAKAVSAALDKESKRKQKVDKHSPSDVAKGPGDKDKTAINSVKDLDDIFGSMDL